MSCSHYYPYISNTLCFYLADCYLGSAEDVVGITWSEINSIRDTVALQHTGPGFESPGVQWLNLCIVLTLVLNFIIVIFKVPENLRHETD